MRRQKFRACSRSSGVAKWSRTSWAVKSVDQSVARSAPGANVAITNTQAVAVKARMKFGWRVWNGVLILSRCANHNTVGESDHRARRAIDEKLSPVVILIPQSREKDLGSSPFECLRALSEVEGLGVNFAKDLLCDKSTSKQILRRPDGMIRDSSE